MSKFKVGDKVVRVCQEGGANDVLVGKVYTIAEIHEEFVRVEGSDRWLCDFRFALPVKEEGEMTAEQIRNEILRINVRIEEAKKDIESAEKERNSLVEKLREKGFELLYSGGVSNIEKRPTEGDKVRVIRVDHDYPKTIYLGYEFVIQRDDGSPLPYMDEYHNWFREDSVVKI